MKERYWIKIRKEKGKLPKEKTPVRVFIDDGEGSFNIFTAHIEEGVWFLYDPFNYEFRIYPRQQFVTHWKHLDEFPSQVKKDLRDAGKKPHGGCKL